ncbi:MAG TPA: MFS transporter [Candidatus Baltobacteraceae bacterium]
MRSKWTVLALIWLSLFVAYLDRVNLSIAGPTMLRELHLSYAQFGALSSAFLIGYAAMQIPAGALADRYGPRRVLAGALTGWSIFTGVTGLASSFWGVALARVGLGLGEGMENGAQFKLLGAAFESRGRSGYGALFLTALAVAPACAAPVAAFVLLHAGWRALFAWFAIPGFVVALLVWLILPASERATESAEPASMRSWLPVLARNGVWLAALAYFGFNIAFWGLLAWLPTYLTDTRHIQLQQLGVAASLPYVGGFFGLLAIGWLGTRVAHARAALVAGAYVFAAVGLYVAYFSATPSQCVAAMTFAAFFLYGGFGPLWAIVLDRAPHAMHGTVAGVVNFCGQIGGFIAPVTIGLIVHATGSFGGGFAFMEGGLLAAAVALLALGMTSKEPTNATET